jgi:peptidoglycan/LPS O-acetylase OafA/YrhL
MATLRDFPTRANSLNAIRLVLATLVIVSHAWPIGGFGGDPQVGRAALGQVAVAGFFAISGWLITQSRLRTGLPTYLRKRFLRIYPGFFVSLLVVAFVIAPVGAALGAGKWGLGAAAQHVAVNAGLLMQEYDVGATPSHVPYPGAWNGSLWTLFYEALCYLVVGVAVTVVGRRGLTPFVGTCWVVTTGLATLTGLGGSAGLFVGLAPYFFAGATLYVLRERIPLDGRVAAGATGWVVAVLALDGSLVLAALPLAYLMLWLGAVLPLDRVGRVNDISYGVYIYAFPVQQLLALAGATAWGVGPYIALSILGTVPLAAASWFAVERPAQLLGRRRGIPREPAPAPAPA